MSRLHYFSHAHLPKMLKEDLERTRRTIEGANEKEKTPSKVMSGKCRRPKVTLPNRSRIPLSLFEDNNLPRSF